MSPNLRIALRFLLARKRSMLMSLAGIVFGVGFFVLTQAQTSGFEEFFIKTILGADGAIRIEDKWQPTLHSLTVDGATFDITNRESRRYIEGVEDPRRLREALTQFSNITAVSEVVQGSITIQGKLRDTSAQIYGINLTDHLAVSDLEEQIVAGSLDAFRSDPTGVMIGRALAIRLQASVGDLVLIQTHAEKQRFRVSAIYKTGITDIDKVRVFAHMSATRSLLKRPFGASFMQVNVQDRDRAVLDALRMDEVLQHSVVSWQERAESWLQVFTFFQMMSALIVSSIILVSGLGMFNTLAMIVMEKTREISILRSMGYTREDISGIFLWQGAVVLAGGTILGWVFGGALTFTVSRIPIHISGIFSTDRFLVHASPWHYVAASIIATVIVMIASLIPARRAARLEPGDVIRGTAT